MKRIAIIGAALLASGGAAFAQPDPNAGAPAPDGNGGGSGAAPAAGDMGPVFSAGGPIIDRALTLGKSGYGLYGDFDVLRVSVTGGGVTVTSTAEGLHFGGGYGITDKVTIGAEYAFSLNSFEIKGPLTLYGAMSLMHTDKLDIGASANLVIDLDATSTDAMGMVTSSTSETLQAGVAVRYKLTPQVALYTGTPIAPGPLGQQLSIGFQEWRADHARPSGRSRPATHSSDLRSLPAPRSRASACRTARTRSSSRTSFRWISARTTRRARISTSARSWISSI